MTQHLIRIISIHTTTVSFWKEGLIKQAHFTEEFTGRYGIIKFDEVLFGNEDRKASLMVSDHRPLWAKFETSVDED